MCDRLQNTMYDRKKHTNLIKRFCKDNNGSVGIEYALITAIISIVIIGSCTQMGVTLTSFFTNLSKSL